MMQSFKEARVIAIIGRRTVSEPFRNLLVKTYPNLNNSCSYWPLLAYLLFPTRIDEGEIIVSRHAIAELLGYSSTPTNFNVRHIFEEFCKDIQPFTWSDYSKAEKRARTVESLEFPKIIQDALKKEHDKLLQREERVYLLTGKPFSKAKQYRSIVRQHNEALKQTAKVKETKVLLDYMNSLPPTLFTKLIKTNGKATLEAIKNLELDSEHQWNIFSSILDNPIQIYQPSDRTVRIFPVGERIVSLKSEIRRVLTKGMAEADLKSAQFSIAATLWDIPSVIEFLENGGDMWEYLYQLGTRNKAALKDILYSLMFGMHYFGILKRLEAIGIKYRDFIALPLIKDLVKARNKEMKRIVKESGATTCFGNFLKLEIEQDEKSILAQCCQAMELKLLFPIIDIAMTARGRKGFAIALWQHDGFTLHSYAAARRNYYKEKCSLLVEQQAHELGIMTKLQWKDL